LHDPLTFMSRRKQTLLLGSYPSSVVPSSMALISRTFPALRWVAPRLSREFFVCRQCLQRPRLPPPSAKLKSKKQSPFLQAPHSRRTPAAPRKQIANLSTWKLSTPLAGLSKTISNSKTRERARYFPEISDKLVAYWLLGSAASVFGIVVFGGLTRLTESGYDPFAVPVLTDRQLTLS